MKAYPGKARRYSPPCPHLGPLCPPLGPLYSAPWPPHPAQRGLHLIPALGHETAIFFGDSLYSAPSYVPEQLYPTYRGPTYYQTSTERPLNYSTLPLYSSPKKKSRLSEKIVRAPSPPSTLPEVHKPPRSSSPRPALSRREILASLEEGLFPRSCPSPCPSSVSLSPSSSFSSSSDGSDSVFSRSNLLQSIQKEPKPRLSSKLLSSPVRFTLGSAGEDTEEENEKEEEENGCEGENGRRQHEEGDNFIKEDQTVRSGWEDQTVPDNHGEVNWGEGENDEQVVPGCQQQEPSCQQQEEICQQVVPQSQQSPVSSQFSPQSVELSDLTWVATLGVGGFGRVELVTGGPHNEPFALKKLKKIEIQDVKQQQHILNEKAVMLKCRSPFIVRLYQTFHTTKYLYMLMEPCLGGELWTLLRNNRRFSDSTASFYVACVILALEYLHGKGIIYRDLKPENLLLDSSGYVKLTDFGFAKQLVGEERAWTFCGTPEYVAPEIITGKSHDQRADIWSVGILVFELITGAPPFANRKTVPGQVYQDILRGLRYTPFPPCINGPASEVIRQCCRLSALQRPTLQQLKHFLWFSHLDWAHLAERSLPPPSVPRISHSISVENFDSYCSEEEPKECFQSWTDSF